MKGTKIALMFKGGNLPTMPDRPNVVNIAVNAGDGEDRPRPTSPVRPTVVPNVERNLDLNRLCGVASAFTATVGLGVAAALGVGVDGVGGAGGGQINSP